MKRIHARETARVLGKPLVKGPTATAYARNVTSHARVVTRLQAKASLLRRKLRGTLAELREAKRRLKLVAMTYEVPEIEKGETLA